MKMTRWLTLGLCASGVLSVFAELPEGYTELEYIKGTSGGNQRILTDYIPSSTDRFVAEIKVINTYTTQALWCSRGTNTADRTMTCFMMTASSKFIFRGDRKNVAGTYGTFWATGYKIIDADYSTGKFYADSALDLTMSSGDFTPVGKLAFFASYVNGGSWANYGLYELHSFKIYNAEGVLVRNFVPARDDSAAANAITRYGL